MIQPFEYSLNGGETWHECETGTFLTNGGARSIMIRTWGPVQGAASSASGEYTYASTQATNCACCGKYKHTPLRIDEMGGYVCLTCIDQKLGSLLGEFGYAERAQAVQPVGQAVPDIGALQEQSAAWFAVCDVLTKLRPGWQLSAQTGLDAAVAAIRRLATPAPEQEAAQVGAKADDPLHVVPPFAAPAGQHDAAVALLAEFVKFHAEPAGVTLETIGDDKAFAATLGEIDRREADLIARAKAIITPVKPQSDYCPECDTVRPFHMPYCPAVARATATNTNQPAEAVANAVAESVNHAEAFELACLKRDKSNMARCYLDLSAALSGRVGGEAK